ncbi:IclR family transcriptional regulator [Nocardia heshunensis]
MARYSNGESAFSRLVRLLEAFDDDTPFTTVSDLSKRTGLSLPTVSRMVSDLVDQGWLQRDADRRVVFGLRMWELGVRAVPTRNLSRVARPYMTELSARLGQNVQLGVRQGNEVIFVELMSTPAAVPAFVREPGDRLPLHVSAPGRVLLAHAPMSFQESFLSDPPPMVSLGGGADLHSLRAQLVEIRRTGVAFRPAVGDPESTAIAVPLRLPGREVVAALSVVMPRAETARTAAVPAALHATGLQIGRALVGEQIHAELPSE